MVFSLGLALIAAALVGRSVGQLRLARTELERTQTEYVLAGAQLQAVADIVRSTKTPPYHWAIATDQGFVDAMAEPERNKLSLAAASHLDDATLRRFDVAEPDKLRASLAEAAAEDPIEDAGALDLGAAWKRCASGMVSGFGTQSTFTYVVPGEPGLGDKLASWRVGETWRIRLTTSTGWRDERIVRFTGDAKRPAATVFRRLSRDHGQGAQCEDVLRAASGAATTAIP
jgi:hypothetical protein